MAALRFRWRLSEYVAISPRDVRQVHGREQALELARAMLKEPAAWPRSLDALRLPDEESLADAIEDGHIVFVRIDERPRLMDAPQIRDLISLAPPFDRHVEPLRTPQPAAVEVPPQEPVAPVEPEADRRATFIELHDVCFGRDRSLMVPAASTGERQSSRLLGALIVACGFAQVELGRRGSPGEGRARGAAVGLGGDRREDRPPGRP